jgi:hypothetical protein
MTIESGNMKQWHATAQAVSHWLLTAMAWIQSQVRHVECVLTMWNLDRFPLSTSASPANCNTTNCFIPLTSLMSYVVDKWTIYGLCTEGFSLNPT